MEHRREEVPVSVVDGDLEADNRQDERHLCFRLIAGVGERCLHVARRNIKAALGRGQSRFVAVGERDCYADGLQLEDPVDDPLRVGPPAESL